LGEGSSPPLSTGVLGLLGLLGEGMDPGLVTMPMYSPG